MVAFGRLLLLSAMVFQVNVVIGKQMRNNATQNQKQGCKDRKAKFVGQVKQAWKTHRKKFLYTSSFVVISGAAYAGYNRFLSPKNDNPNTNVSKIEPPSPPRNEDKWIDMMTYLVAVVLIIGALGIVYFCYCRPIEEEEEAEMPTDATAAYMSAFGRFKGGGGPFEGGMQHLSAMKGKSKSAARPVGTAGTAGQAPNTSPGSVTPKVANSNTSTG